MCYIPINKGLEEKDPNSPVQFIWNPDYKLPLPKDK
jgi:hypothetical protein